MLKLYLRWNLQMDKYDLAVIFISKVIIFMWLWLSWNKQSAIYLYIRNENCGLPVKVACRTSNWNGSWSGSVSWCWRGWWDATWIAVYIACPSRWTTSRYCSILLASTRPRQGFILDSLLFTQMCPDVSHETMHSDGWFFKMNMCSVREDLSHTYW